MQLTIKLKKGNKWITADMPPIQQVSTEVLRTWIGTPCVLEFIDQRGCKRYAWGDESTRQFCNKPGCHQESMESFCDYWSYMLRDIAIAAFSEARQERRLICEADKVPEAELQKIYVEHPEIYGQQELFEKTSC